MCVCHISLNTSMTTTLYISISKKQTAPSNRNYEGGFGSALMHKDLTLALDAAKGERVASPLGSAAHQLYTLMVSHGAGHKDFSAIIQYLNGEHTK